MRRFAAERTHATLMDGVVIFLVLSGAALLLWIFRPTGANFLAVRVVLDHDTIAEFDLTDAKSHLFDIPNTPYEISLEVADGRIRVAHSACPSQDCIRIGWVARSGGQIVCLPNHLIVSVHGVQTPEVDGVVG